MPNKEDLITTAFVKVLRPMRHGWMLTQHPSAPFIENDKEPDVIVTEPKRNPIAIEDKVDNQRSADLSGERQLKDFYLGKTLKTIGHTIHTGIAVRFPYRFRTMEQAKLDEKMEEADDIAYCLLSIDEPHRFPKEGWLTGSVADIANAIWIGSMPVAKIEEASQILENGVDSAGRLVDIAVTERPEIGKQIEKILYQESCPQTTRMAMLIIGNAFIFQSSLAGKPELENVPSLSQLRSQNGLLDSDLVFEAWNAIQTVNYHSIYDVAVGLVNAISLDDRLVGKVLYTLRNTARKLEQMGLAREHELAGIVFQKLITDRRFIKAYYTRPESSTLLSALMLPELKRDAKQIKVADFACGTGTLLNNVYQRILSFHEQIGGKGQDIHQHMLENNLVGCDILPNAAHLTASIIASTYPDTKIGDTRIHTMAYGTKRFDGLYAIGALNLLSNPEETLPIPMTTSQRVGGHGDKETHAQQEFRHEEFDFIIQNPPYTKSNTDKNSEVPKTTFGDKDPEVEKAMKKSLKVQKTTVGDGNAGIASHFVELGHKMLKLNGRMAMVLPINTITGTSWRKVRNLWGKKYQDLIVVTIADADIENSTFSADTGIAECLVIATKGISKDTGRGTFVCLHRRPTSILEALEIANYIHRLKDIRKLESGITGGNPIKVGTEILGYAMNAPLPDVDEGWAVCRTKDMSVIQTAYQLANGHLKLPRQTESFPIPICRLSEIAKTSPGPLDIYGDGGRGGFDIENGCPDTADYPCLWHVDSSIQQTMLVSLDAHALPRPNKEAKIADIMAVNSRVHYSESLRFNAGSILAMFTEQKSIGVNTLPNVAFVNEDYEYTWVLWGNSTLGLLCHWMQSGKQQEGRGILRKKTLRSLPTLDVTRLKPSQLAAAQEIFQELKHERMLPFNEMMDDPVRQELDRRLLSEVLGFGKDTHPEVHEGIDLLRAKLCAEPSIFGTKNSKCDLEAEAQKLELQSKDSDVVQGELFL